MTEIERKALELIEEARELNKTRYFGMLEVPKSCDVYTYFVRVCNALLLSIEQHEAFRQEVSDAVVAFMMDKPGLSGAGITRFIITKPDPLVIEAREICARVCEGWIDIPKDRAAAYRAGAHDDEADFAYVYAALAKRGLEIREKSDG